jgi:NAD-dependent deacetylase
MTLREKIKKTAQLIEKAEKITVLTGAGISVESGIPDFRSPGGLWEKFDPFEYAHISSFKRDPYKVWEMLKEMGEILESAEPNFAHNALKILEDNGKNVTIITQNIDGLHTKAGSKIVYEYHGTWNKMECIKCGKTEPTSNFNLNEIPMCPTCNFPYKPAVIFFGEPIDPVINVLSNDAASSCDIFMVIGTSAQVYPAASLPSVANSRNIPIIEINLERTPLTTSITTFFLQGKAGEIMKNLIEELKYA